MQADASSSAEIEARKLLARDLVGPAVALAFAHGLDDLAAELLAQGWVGMLCGAGQFDAFFAAVERIGADRYQRWPELEAASIFALTMQTRLRVAAARLDELEQRVESLREQNRSFMVVHQRAPYDRPEAGHGMYSWIAVMRVMQAAFGGRSEEALRLGADWRQRFERTPDYELAVVHVSESVALCMLDRVREGEAAALAALAIFRRENFELGMAWSAVSAACARLVTGRVAAAQALLDSTLQHAAPRLREAPQTLAAIDIAHDLAAFERGEFAPALARAVDRIEGRRVSVSLPILMLIDRLVAARADGAGPRR